MSCVRIIFKDKRKDLTKPINKEEIRFKIRSLRFVLNISENGYLKHFFLNSFIILRTLCK